MTFSLLQFLYKKCYQSDHQRAPWLLSSRVMSTFAIKSHQYTITLYTPGHLQISWDVFAKKSADILSFRISFITISNYFNLLAQSHGTAVHTKKKPHWKKTRLMLYVRAAMSVLVLKKFSICMPWRISEVDISKEGFLAAALK